jgi:hypothetical protein
MPMAAAASTSTPTTHGHQGDDPLDSAGTAIVVVVVDAAVLSRGGTMIVMCWVVGAALGGVVGAAVGGVVGAAVGGVVGAAVGGVVGAAVGGIVGAAVAGGEVGVGRFVAGGVVPGTVVRETVVRWGTEAELGVDSVVMVPPVTVVVGSPLGRVTVPPFGRDPLVPHPAVASPATIISSVMRRTLHRPRRARAPSTSRAGDLCMAPTPTRLDTRSSRAP